MVLISHSHDSPEHESKVLALADRLCSEGVDVMLDQYEPFPPQGWIGWMKQHVQDADFVVMVFTERYGTGLGTTYESQLIQQLLYDQGGRNEKCIPVVWTDSDRQHIPIDLRKYTHYPLDTGYEDLYRLLTNQPKATKPVLGRLRSLEAKRRQSFFWNVPARNSWFTGRQAFLETVHQALGQTKAAAISGIGGMGKTQTAIEYGHRYRGDYQSVLWASAGLAGFAALANLLELPEKDEKELGAIAAAVSRWLQSNSGWMLILDNVDTVEELNEVRRLVPFGATGHLLLTTRLQATGRVAKAVELEKMEPEEGASFLLRRAADSDPKLAEEISIELGGLPLALDQAGAFIEEVPSTLAEYLRLYRTEGVRLRKRRGEVATEHDSVTVTFSLTFARLEKKNLAAADLVRACAFLAPDAIPEETLNQPQLSELDFLEAIEEAGRFALVRRNAPNKTVDIHRQVQEVLKDEMDLSTRRLWAECVIHMLALVFPSPLEFRNWTQCERLLPHARAAARHTSDFALDSQAASHLLNDAACYLFNRAEYAEAEPLFHRALAIDKKSLGADHPDTAQSLNNLAALYHRQGHYDQAEPLYQRALEIDENSLGADHPATATALNNLAEVYRNQHHYDRAEPLYQRAIAIREKALGPDDPDTAVTLNNLALLYDSQGHYERAEPLFVRALPILERARGGVSTPKRLRPLITWRYSMTINAAIRRLSRCTGAPWQSSPTPLCPTTPPPPQQEPTTLGFSKK